VHIAVFVAFPAMAAGTLMSRIERPSMISIRRRHR
jgi:hypothetical protein